MTVSKNRWPLASGTGSTRPWRVFVAANPALNGTPAEARAHRRQVHELAMTDPRYAARRQHPQAASPLAVAYGPAN